VRFTLANLLIFTVLIAFLLALAIQWRGIAILAGTAVFPIVVFRLRKYDSTRYKLPALMLFLLGMFLLYVASLGPYYFLVINVLSSESPVVVFGSYFYAPLFALFRRFEVPLLEPFFNHYLVEWINYGSEQNWR
jgi:hypothetical protein